MTVGPPEYADDMPTAQVQIDSIRQDIRALSDTVSIILVRLDKMDGRFNKMDDRFDKMDQEFAELKGTMGEILTLVRAKS